MKDKYGQEIEDRVYNQQDFDKVLILNRRTDLVAAKITEYLKTTNRFDKTIVFCENIDHARRMRQALTNANSDLAAENHKYVMQITGDNKEGKAELDNFIFPESVYPVIVTTSKLMTTGVDAKTCKLIVLDQRIQSMTEFKQIIGRGTRIDEDYGKLSFTIMDFKQATKLFADPDFDGDPVQVYEPGEDDPVVPPEVTGEGKEPDQKTEDNDQFLPNDGEDDTGRGVPPEPKFKYVVDNVKVRVASERVQYYDVEGKLITESLKDYTRNTLSQNYQCLDEFLRRWSTADKKHAVIEELAKQGVFFEALAEEVGKDYDPFDLICHVVWDEPPLIRQERAREVKKRNYFAKYGNQARRVLEALLDKYADEGIEAVEEPQILTINPFTEMGTTMELVQAFGGVQGYRQAIKELEKELYQA